MNAQVEEARRSAEEEARVRAALGQQLRNLSGDLNAVRGQLDDEAASKCELQKLLAKASGEAQQWRAKCETEGVVRAEELEEAKRKLGAKLAEAEDQVCKVLALVFIWRDFFSIRPFFGFV